MNNIRIHCHMTMRDEDERGWPVWGQEIGQASSAMPILERVVFGWSLGLGARPCPLQIPRNHLTRA